MIAASPECITISDGEDDSENILQKVKKETDQQQHENDMIAEIRVAGAYTAPKYILEIIQMYNSMTDKDKRYLPQRNFEQRKSNKRLHWTKRQDQKIIIFAIQFLTQDPQKDLSILGPFNKMHKLSKAFNTVKNPRQLQRRLIQLSDDKNLLYLHELCGLNICSNETDIIAVEEVSNKIRASCLPLNLIRKYRLEKYFQRRREINI